jgi:hypothetical protein
MRGGGKQRDFEELYGHFFDDKPFPDWTTYAIGDEVVYFDDSMCPRLGVVTQVGDITICGNHPSSLWEDSPKAIYVNKVAYPLRFIRKIERAEELYRYVDDLAKMLFPNLSVVEIAKKNERQHD